MKKLTQIKTTLTGTTNNPVVINAGRMECWKNRCFHNLPPFPSSTIPVFRSAFTIILFVCIAQFALATTYTWNGSVSSVWGNANNWTPNTGVPGAADNITIVTGTNQPTFDNSSTGCTNLTVTSGTLDLGGYSFSVTGAATFTSGIVKNGTITASGTSTAFNGTTFGVTGNSPATTITASPTTLNSLQNTRFYGNANITCNSDGYNMGFSSNIFGESGTASTYTLTNTYTVSWRMGGGSDVYYGDVTFRCTNSGNIYIGVSASPVITFYKNVTVISTGTGGISFGGQGGTVLLTGTGTITSSGYTGQVFDLSNFTSVSSSNTINVSCSSASINMGSNSTFNGNVTIGAANAYIFNNATYNGAASFTQTGSGGSGGYCGNNTFNSDVTFTPSGSGAMDLSLNSGNTTRFNGDLILNSTGSGSIRVGYGGGTATIATGKQIKTGTSGFTGPGSQLYLQNITQDAGTNSNPSLTLTCISTATATPTLLTIRSCTVTGSATISADRPDIGTSTFGTASTDIFTLTKTVHFNTTGLDNSYGGNTYNGAVFIHEDDGANNSGTAGGWVLEQTAGDNFMDDATFVRHPMSGYMYLANAVGTTCHFYGSLNCTWVATGLHPGTQFYHTLLGGNGWDGGTIEFNGSKTGCSFNHNTVTSTRKFSHLVINKTAGATIQIDQSFVMEASGGTPSLTITSGTLIIPSTIAFTGTANVTATGGDFQIARLANPQPELSGTYSLTGGTITLNGAGAQTFRAVSPYYSITCAGTGAKTLGGNTTVNGILTMGGTGPATFALGAFTLTYGASATLQYQASGVAQTTNAA